ncbi:hypothetical protein PO002_11035 [Cupriavidus necator]|uniref:hypothetical protein n=1 Tax=Cupriavidus necator TaxID=106590 RepID=UPI0039C47942
MIDQDLRSTLCHAAELGYKEWQHGCAIGFEKLAQSLITLARQHKAGCAYLKFDSELQAEYVRDELTQRGVPSHFADSRDMKVGLNVRWSEDPAGKESLTCKIAIWVGLNWQIESVDERLERSLAEYAGPEAAARLFATK